MNVFILEQVYSRKHLESIDIQAYFNGIIDILTKNHYLFSRRISVSAYKKYKNGQI